MTEPNAEYSAGLLDLSGRSALVTGSSRGIGRAIALGLAEAGAEVAVHCAGNVEAAEEVAGRIRSMDRAAPVIRAPLDETGACERIAGQVEEALGGVDILIHNASVQVRAGWREVTTQQFDRQVAVNLRAVLELTQRLAPRMIENRWGRVLNIGSVQQAVPHPDMAVYAATKSAMENLTRNLAGQLAPDGVTVNLLAPGVIDTDRNREALNDEDYRAKVLARIPARMVGRPRDCVGAALLLCSEAGRYITGQCLYVDGGMSL